MTKQWSLQEVAEKHGYNNVSYSEIHDQFKNWIETTFKLPPAIVDIGGGNGRAYLSLKDYVSKYTCLDVNKASVDAGRLSLKDDKVNFFVFDVEIENSFPECDVFYIDSTLTMLENPNQVLLKCKQAANYIYVCRTPNFQMTKKSSYKWNGMTKVSWLWEFSHLEIQDFCSKNDMNFQKLNDSTFVIQVIKASN